MFFVIEIFQSRDQKIQLPAYSSKIFICGLPVLVVEHKTNNPNLLL